MPNLSTKNNIRRSSLVWVHLAAMLAIVMWGASFVSTQVLLDEYQFTPTQVYVLRCAVAYVVLLVFCHKQIRAINYQHEFLFLLCGMCGGSVYYLTENNALLWTSAANVSLITATPPLLTALLVGLLYKDERPNRGLVTGLIVAFAGVVCVVLGSSEGESVRDAELGMFGDLLAVLSALSWAIYSLLLRKLNPLYSAMIITRKTFFYGLITSLPFLMGDHSTVTLSTFANAGVWINLLFLGLGASFLSFVIWTAVVGKLGALKAGNYLYFQPIVTLIVAAIAIHQLPTVLGVTGCVITIAGVWLGDYLSRRIQSKR